jgi:hypothetical protein
MNDKIKVKLTKEGAKVHNENYPSDIKLKENDILEIQLWEFMQYFGDRCFNGGPNMIVDNIMDIGDIDDKLIRHAKDTQALMNKENEELSKMRKIIDIYKEIKKKIIIDSILNIDPERIWDIEECIYDSSGTILLTKYVDLSQDNKTSWNTNQLKDGFKNILAILLNRLKENI